MFLKVKISDISISSLNLGDIKFYEVGLAAMFVVSFPNFKPRALSLEPLGDMDRVMHGLEGQICFCYEPLDFHFFVRFPNK